MNETDIGLLIESMFRELRDRGARVVGSGVKEDGHYLMLLKIDNRSFTVLIRGDDLDDSTAQSLMGKD